MLVILVVGYFWLMALSVLSIVRYMAPVTAVLFPFTGLASMVLIERLRRGREASQAVPQPG